MSARFHWMTRMLGAAGLVAMAGAAMAANIDATNPERLEELMRDAGYRAALGEDSVGDPAIDGALSQTEYTVLFFGCDDDHANCRDVQFWARYAGANVSDAEIDSFNQRKRWVRVHRLEDGNVDLEMDVNLYGGVSEANFLDTVDWWRIVIEEFEDHIDH